MIYFYVGLGIAMLTGIIGIFEMATTITRQQINSRPPKINEDERIVQKQNDRRFLQLLNESTEPLGEGNALCLNIKDGISNINNSNYSLLSKYNDLLDFNPGIPISSSHSSFIKGCDLNKGKHRLIIVPNNDISMKYSLYSCLTISSKCKFEEDWSIMSQAIFGLLISVLTTSGLVLGVEYIEKSYRNSGRYKMNYNELKILQSAGLNSSSNINSLNEDLKSMPQKQWSHKT